MNGYDFSKSPPGQQTMVIKSIVDAVEQERLWVGEAAKKCLEGLVAQICIGDGYIYVFKRATLAGYFAAYFANLIELLVASHLSFVEFHFRMGAHIGPVYRFYDPGRKNWNFIGDGINGGQRVLGAVGKDVDDVLYISAQLRQAILRGGGDSGSIPNILIHAHNRGRKADKHGNPWRVYEINHSALIEPLNREIRRAIEEVRRSKQI